MLLLNKNYASHAIAGLNTTTAGITMLLTIVTEATVPAGGLVAIGNNAQNQYTGVRIVAGGVLEAGMRSVSGTPASLGALAPNTEYTISLTRDGAGNISAVVNGAAPVTKAVAPGALAYNYYAVGAYYSGAGGWVSTTQCRISNVFLFSRILTAPEIAAYHAKNLGAIAATNLVERHDLISDLNSDSGGNPLTFVDPENDPAAFNAYDPFLPAQSITSADDPIIGQETNITVMGFDPAVNAGKLDDVDLVSASNTKIMPRGLIDGQTCPRAGANRVLTVIRGSKTATLNKTVKPVPGLVAVEILPGFKTGEADSIAFQFNPPLQASDIFYNDPTKGTMGTDASYKATHTGEQIIWHHEAATKIVRSFLLITGEQGQVISIRRFFGAVYMAADYFHAKKLKASGF